MVGSKFIEVNSADFEIKSPGAAEIDIVNKDQIAKIVAGFNPDAVVNFAAYTNVEEAENQKDDKNGICFQINAIGAGNAAEVTRNFGKHLVQISTEYVFDGTKQESPYTEEDKPNPINWYGATKLFGEENVLSIGGKSLIVRISMPYSPFYELKKDIARFFLQELKNNRAIKAVEDQWITPTLVLDIANALRIFIESGATGLYHVSCKDFVTPLRFAENMAEVFNLDRKLVKSLKLDEYNEKKTAKLLKYSWLNPLKFESEFGIQTLHTVSESLQIFKQMVDAGNTN